MTRFKIVLIGLFAWALLTSCDDSDNPVSELLEEEASLTLSDEEQASLAFLREEEKLARDVYFALGEKFGHNTFLNIQRSEQEHMDQVKILLDQYGLPDPVAETQDARGVFLNPDLQALYDLLMERGEVSLEEALRVGMLIEETDIADLQAGMDVATNPDFIDLYSRLLKGSENHLRAFSDALARL